jgi:HSP20 family molecular chaperone IbpA
LKRKINPFPRIGDAYGHFIDYDHFLGRSSFEDLWMTDLHAASKAEDKAYHLAIEVPGYAKNDIELCIQYDTLKIKLKDITNKEDLPESMLNFQGRKERLFILTKDVDQDKVTAELRNGILRVTLPKYEGHLLNKKTITIQ